MAHISFITIEPYRNQIKGDNKKKVELDKIVVLTYIANWAFNHLFYHEIQTIIKVSTNVIDVVLQYYMQAFQNLNYPQNDICSFIELFYLQTSTKDNDDSNDNEN